MFKKKVYEDFVDLSIGRVYIRPLTNSIYNKALARSGVIEGAVENYRFLNYCERKMTQLPFWKWGSLTIRDGDILRRKIIDMLKKDNIISDKKLKKNIDEDKADLFANVSDADKKWFNKAAAEHKRKMGLL